MVKSLVFAVLFGFLTISASGKIIVQDSLDSESVPIGLVRLKQADQFANVGRFKEALVLYEEHLKIMGLGSDMAFSYAKSLASDRQTEASLKILKYVVDNSLATAKDIKENKELAFMHDDPRWKELLVCAEKHEALQEKIYSAPAIESKYRPFLSEVERIAGVSRIWSEVKYNFANFDLVPELDWDKVYLQTLQTVKNTMSTKDYYCALVAMVAQLNDGHSNVYPPAELYDQFFARPPIKTILIDGKVLTSEILDENLKNVGFSKGQEILAIDGIPVHLYAQKEIAPYVSASTTQDHLNRTYSYQLLAGDSSKPIVLSMSDPSGKTLELKVNRYSMKQLENIPKPPQFSWKMLPSNIAIVELGGFADDTASREYLAHFEEICQSDAIIFDLRRNGGGSSSVGDRILSTLTPKPFLASRWQSRKYVPVWRAWQKPQQDEVSNSKFGQETIQPDLEHQFAKPVAVLTGVCTFSAGEDFVAEFKGMKRGFVIGEPTAGSTGQPLVFKLPGGGFARVCVKRDKMPDGTEFVGKGIIPDLFVQLSEDGFRVGRDEILAAAVEHLRKIIGQ